MSISDVNPLGGEAVGGNRSISNRQKTEAREKTGAAAAEQTDVRQQVAEEGGEVTAPRDVFQTSTDSRKVSELADMVEQTEETPRQERVTQARERVASGYYKSDEFLGNLGSRLVSSGLLK